MANKNYEDVTLRRNLYPSSIGPIQKDDEERNKIILDNNQQDLLKQLICCSTIEELRCASDCISCAMDDMRKDMEADVSYDDFMQKKKSETQEMPTMDMSENEGEE